MKQCSMCGRWTPGVNGDFCSTCYMGMGGQAPEAVLREAQQSEVRWRYYEMLSGNPGPWSDQAQGFTKSED